MGKLANPAALARVLSLQRANARAKASKAADGLSEDQKAAPASRKLSRRIDSMLTNISSSSSISMPGANDVDEFSNGDDDDGCGYDGTHKPSDLRRSFSQEIDFTQLKPLFASLSERIDRGLGLWDREFSATLSDSSDAGVGSQRRLDSSGYSQLTMSSKACKREAGTSTSSSSWSETSSLDDVMQMHEQVRCRNTQLHSPSGEAEGGGIHDLQQKCSSKSWISGRVECQEVETSRESMYPMERAPPADAIMKDIHNRGSGNEDGTHLGEPKKDQSLQAGLSTTEEPAGGGGACNRRLPPPPVAAAVAELPANSVAVEKVSTNPEEDFRESMYEMMMEKGDVEEDMEELLNCYLLLNPAELHQTIREAFSHVWIDIIMTIR